MGWIHGFLSNFTGGSSVDLNHDEDTSIASGITNLNDAINESERDYADTSADKVNEFNAEQAELNRLFQAESAEKAMQFESAEAEKNRQWQMMMSNTAYQRAVKDLEKAGLNPILAYSQGGAATTSGAMASGQVASGSSASGVKASASGENVISIASQLIANTARALIK